MLHQAASQDDHARGPRIHGLVVEKADVSRDVQDEALPLVAKEIEHVPDAPVGDGGTEHGDVVLVAPVVHARLIVNLLPKPMDHLAGRPDGSFLLLVQHLVQKRVHPVFEEAVVVVRHEQVAKAIDS
eukprot:scaffold173_cov221-Pinguiococcus_pyrenoidosus.AAC.1